MKKVLSVLMALAFVVALLVAGTPVLAQATVTEFSGTETFVASLDPGTVWGHPGGPSHRRGGSTLFKIETNDARVTGTNTITNNGNYIPDGPSNAWGTFRIEADAGFWEGIWTSDPFAGRGRLVGHGGGGFEDLKLTMTYEFTPVGIVVNGTILDPHGG